jgi:hypothetical protein
MTDNWEDMATGLRHASDGLRLAIQGFEQVVNAGRNVHAEHGHFREKVDRLEHLMLEMLEQQRQTLELQADLLALRDRLKGNDPNKETP